MHFGPICKNDKEVRIMKKVNARFEDQLDIRSLVRVRTNLALILSLVLTEE